MMMITTISHGETTSYVGSPQVEENGTNYCILDLDWNDETLETLELATFVEASSWAGDAGYREVNFQKYGLTYDRFEIEAEIVGSKLQGTFESARDGAYNTCDFTLNGFSEDKIDSLKFECQSYVYKWSVKMRVPIPGTKKTYTCSDMERD